MNRDAELAAIVGWLQGFAPTVWLLPWAQADGKPLVADEECMEYEAKIKRLAELMEEERSCRYVFDEKLHAWVCSECEGLEPVCDDPNYCIDCGAKVVEL